MDINKIFRAICEGKEWIFSGIGVEILSFIRKHIISRKKSGDNSDTYIAQSKMHDNNNASDGNIITGKKNQIIQNDNSSTISVDGTGNVAGNGNSVINNFIYNENDNNTKENANSWFSDRFKVFLSLLNDARSSEKEYTVEYISSLIGLKNVGDLKVYLIQCKEPDDQFKKKFVKLFGVNEEWMVHGRGEYPFASNIIFGGNNPMDILRRDDLKDINKFIVVIGDVEGSKQACIIRQKNELCYELYPKYFILNSNVGGTGTKNLVEFYRFLREAGRIKKLDDNAYFASEEQMSQLMSGAVCPKKVERFKLASCFIDDFMCINESDIDRNKKNWGEEFILVQQKIAANIENYDRINQESDLKLIKKNLGEDSLDKEEGAS